MPQLLHHSKVSRVSTKRIPFRILFVTDRHKIGEAFFIPKIIELVRAGVDAILFREKDLSAGRRWTLFKELLSRLAKEVPHHKTHIIVHGDITYSIYKSVQGLHFPEDHIPLPIIRKFLPRPLLLGVSVHSVKSAQQAEQEGANYIIAGTIFDTPGKKGAGLEHLRSICESVTLPVFAIGGIEPGNARVCLEMGAYGIAVVGALARSDHVAQTLLSFQSLFHSPPHSP